MGAVLFYPHYVTSSLRVKSQIVVISLQKHPTISWIRTLQALFSAFELCTEIDGVNDWIHQWIGLREHPTGRSWQAEWDTKSLFSLNPEPKKTSISSWQKT